MKQVIYFGSFYSVKGDIIGVSIWRDNEDGTIVTPQELIFEGEDPLVIEWGECQKEDGIQGASATLRIESPSDRTYLHLYTEKIASIGIDVTINDTPYWSGTIDPEQYEEPYERAANYPVSLTFSDFGLLDRIKFDLKNDIEGAVSRLSIKSYIEEAISRLTLTNLVIDDTQVSTTIPNSPGLNILENITVPFENFYDEESEPNTWKEVIEGILQPLGLKMVQRGGKIFLYDLNGLYHNEDAEVIAWDGSEQNLSIDKITSVVRVSFSPYGDKKVYDGAIEHDDVCKDVDTIRYYTDATPQPCSSPTGFNIAHYPQLPSDEYPFKIGDGQLFRIDSVFSGSDDCGIVGLLRGNYNTYHTSSPEYNFEKYFISPTSMFWDGQIDVNALQLAESLNPIKLKNTSRLFTTDAKYISRCDNGRMLKISLSVLFDPRYNPFESDSDKINCMPDFEKWKQHVRYGYIPADLFLQGDDGKLYKYSNRSRIDDYNAGGTWFRGAWIEVTPDSKFGEFLIAFYDKSKPGDECPFSGWATNRHALPYRKPYSVPEIIKRVSDGEFVVFPPVSGKIWMEVGNGAVFITGANQRSDNKISMSIIRWMLYKDPKIEIVDRNGQDVEDKDIEYSGDLNENAAEELSIDTICGSMNNDVLPSAKGVYRFMDGTPIEILHRASHEGHPENLLIGTLYSQYATRKIILSGEAELLFNSVIPYLERNQEGKRFICTSEIADLRMATSEIQIVELSPDEYDSITPHKD